MDAMGGGVNACLAVMGQFEKTRVIPTGEAAVGNNG